MTATSSASDPREIARLVILLFFVGLCFLAGGGARLDILGPAIVQPAAVVCVAAILLIPGSIRFDEIRAPLFLLAGLAVIMAVQLIPLPPEMWTKLPGHAPFAASADVAGMAQPWRPLSLTPDLTLASLVSLVVPAAALLIFGSVPLERTYILLPCLLIGAGLSALLGLGQIVGGPQSGLYRYEVTNIQSAVGLFSNRNHQAVLLAMTFPMLALWVNMPTRDPRNRSIRYWVAGAASIFLVPMVVITGSRAGLALAVLGMAFAWWQIVTQTRSRERLTFDRRVLMTRIVPALGAVVLIALVIYLSKAEAIDRLLTTSFRDDPRAQFTPVLLRMSADFLPVGSGFGSFDQMFRYYEPVELLRTTYLNHAHNDVLELLITGGVPAAIVALLFLGWALPRIIAVIRARSPSRSDGFAKLAAAMLVLMLASSIVDYPLRTPLLSVLFAISCGWLVAAGRGRGASAQHP